MNKNSKPVQTIDVNAIKGRDYALLSLIQGATKSGVALDRRKEANKKACRGRYRGED